MKNKEELMNKVKGYYTDTCFNGVVDWEIDQCTGQITYVWQQFPSEQEYLEYINDL